MSNFSTTYQKTMSIQVQDISKNYGAQKALDGVNF